MTDFPLARRNMVESQLRPNLIADPALLAAVSEIPREAFLPAALRSVAYVDEDVPLGGGRYTMEPLVLCKLLQAAAPKPADVALDVGCNIGYSTALLAKMVGTAIGIDEDGELIKAASASVHGLGIDNAVFMQRAPQSGYAEQGPYNVILINGAIDQVPQTLLDQLAEGGRLAAVIGKGRVAGRGTLFRKLAGAVSSRALFDAGTPSLPGLQHRPSFQF